MKKIFDRFSTFYFIMMCIMVIGTCIGVVGGTIGSKPYDERIYVLVLSTICLILFIWFENKYDKQREIEKQKELKEKDGK